MVSLVLSAKLVEKGHTGIALAPVSAATLAASAMALSALSVFQ